MCVFVCVCMHGGSFYYIWMVLEDSEYIKSSSFMNCNSADNDISIFPIPFQISFGHIFI